ncbi:MAG: BTAD domain-containing putative transcriptional regulator [Gemmatimonadales bacterium]
MTARGTRGPRLALLALLALSRGRPVTRDKLAALLWPEAGQQRARAQLSDTVYLVRGVLGDAAILSAGDDLLLNPDAITSDLASFERLLAGGDLEAAVGMVAGPLLDGFHLPGAAELDQLLSAERAELADRYAAALESLAEAAEAAQQHATAGRWWRRLAAHDPGSGRVALRLMRALEAAGDRAGALRFARAHAEVLRREFDTGPDPEVVAFEEQLRRAPRLRSAPSAVPADRQPDAEPPAPSMADQPAARRSSRRLGWVLAATPLVAVGLWWAAPRLVREPPGHPAGGSSVAVLPFTNLSADPDHAYFSDGLSEQVISALSRVEKLRVAARSSSFALRNGSLDVRAIGDTLGVQTVLEGAVRREGDRLRVTARLSDATSGYQLWSAQYEREMADAFVVQDEIARDIARALELRLTASATVGADDPPGLEAYDRYLRGLYLRNGLSVEALRQAAAHFDRAIALEPGFALAYAGKASVVAPLIYFGGVSREDGVAEMRALTDRALALAPELGEAHVALGILKLFFEWDWEGARVALVRAVELNPNDAHAHHHLANYLHAMGRVEEAAVSRERALALDPLNARTRFVMANEYLDLGRLDRAIDTYRRAFQLDPVNPLGLGLGPSVPATAGLALMTAGRADEAVEDLLRVALLRNANTGELDGMRRAYAAAGLRGFWRAWLDLDARQSAGSENTLRTAALWALAGDTTRAMDGLERAYVERNPGLIYLRTDFGFAGFRSHPRFRQVAQRMHLPEPQLPAR